MSIRHRLTSCAMIALFFTLPFIAKTAFSLFGCIAINKPADPPVVAAVVGRFWVSDTSQTCFAGYHRALALALGVPLVVLLCMVLPAFTVLFLLANRGRLRQPTFQRHYGLQ